MVPILLATDKCIWHVVNRAGPKENEEGFFKHILKFKIFLCPAKNVDCFVIFKKLYLLM